MKKLLFLLVPLLITGCIQSKPIEEKPQQTELNQLESIAVSCEEVDGLWLDKFLECEGVGEDWCLEKEGKFIGCESACRNESEQTICTAQCVPVCSFDEPDIKINNLTIDQKISSPLIIKGEARGGWFFEGDFPVELVDSRGNIISKGFVTAEGEWMTDEIVSFSGELKFEKITNSTEGILRLRRDNPSGLPENEEVLEFPIKF